MKTSTAQYEMANGRKPRGYGMWIFTITFTYDSGRQGIRQVARSGRYGEAKQNAVSHVRKLAKMMYGSDARVTTVHVEP